MEELVETGWNVLRLYFSDGFRKAMDEHAQTEFPKLAELLRTREAA